MSIRDKIIKLFASGRVSGDEVGVRELMNKMPGELRASVSKECRYMEAMGLLSSERANNWHHGKRFLFKPTQLLLDCGTLAFHADTLARILSVPMTNKDLRYALTSACGKKIGKREIQATLEELIGVGRVTRAPGGSAKYPRYVRKGMCVTGSELVAVAAAWARAGGARPLVCHQSSALHWR